MKPGLLAPALAFFFALPAHATLITDFVGSYDLTVENPGKVETKLFCHKGLAIELDGNEAKLYSADSMSYGPMYQAVVNGSGKSNKGSHGEGMSARKGEDTVSFANETLSFEYSGVEYLFGLPVSRAADSVAVKLSGDKKTLYVTRGEFAGPVKGIGKRDKINCIYERR
jgi:hypothetical protein